MIQFVTLRTGEEVYIGVVESVERSLTRLLSLGEQEAVRELKKKVADHSFQFSEEALAVLQPLRLVHDGIVHPDIGAVVKALVEEQEGQITLVSPYPPKLDDTEVQQVLGSLSNMELAELGMCALTGVHPMSLPYWDRISMFFIQGRPTPVFEKALINALNARLL